MRRKRMLIDWKINELIRRKRTIFLFIKTVENERQMCDSLSSTANQVDSLEASSNQNLILLLNSLWHVLEEIALDLLTPKREFRTTWILNGKLMMTFASEYHADRKFSVTVRASRSFPSTDKTFSSPSDCYLFKNIEVAGEDELTFFTRSDTSFPPAFCLTSV